MRRVLVLTSVGVITAAMSLVSVNVPARAGFPGSNGRLVYVVGCCDMYSVRTVGADGSAEATLTDPVAQFMPAGTTFSPDGSKIAFTYWRWVVQRHRYAVDLAVMSSDGTGSTLLTRGARREAEPAWSPDGARIAFSHHMPSGSFELFVMNADGTGRARLTSDRRDDLMADWSPDGSHVVFVRERRAAADLFLIHPDGTGLQRLTTSRGWEYDPDWSPDGSRVVFSKNGEIWERNVTSGASSRLVTSAGVWERNPTVSPDGLRMAWIRFSPGADEDLHELVVGNSDGTDAVTIASCSLNCGMLAVDWQPLL